ncbi:hypothetical protein O7543_28320 [Solwaraspora sp. WMMA2080]|uniref:hypothetical protein n=1 Tax=unclassified Solwaraspora TaxID=2627926 RepID=UPI00248AC7BA|nr:MULTISPECIES: hypothetical protein [unclassified Solwaraspora]WBB95471.1 hypothetical protein O7553_19045 [Solwaraspora sp. WMMA2059]WBC20624.1 hypothetical protein O7543_28320 [Solwaraspora sp. WMMA2080]
MRYRRQAQQRSTPDRSFASRFKHEVAKEGSGTLVQQLGAGLGALIGLAATRWGLPPAPVAIAGAFINTVLDRRREARAGDGTTSGGSGAGGGGARPLSSVRRRYPGHRSRGGGDRTITIGGPASRGGSGGGGGSTGSYLQQLRRLLDEIETQQAKLANVANAMRASQLGVAQLLAGGRQDRTQEIYTWSELSRANVEEAAILTHQAVKSLRAYLSNL